MEALAIDNFPNKGLYRNCIYFTYENDICVFLCKVSFIYLKLKNNKPNNKRLSIRLLQSWLNGPLCLFQKVEKTAMKERDSSMMKYGN